MLEMYRKEKRIPTLLGLLIVFIGIASAIYFDGNTKQLTSSAKDSLLPREVHFTNITDNSMTISWLTDGSATGIIYVTQRGNKNMLLDDLDSDNIPRPRKTHYITIKNLQPDTLYKINIISGSKSCSSDALCPTFSQKTGIKLNGVLDLPPLHGQIMTTEQKGAKDSIVYLLIGKSVPLSTRVDSLGMWVIPLNNIRSQDFLNRPEISDTDTVQIIAKMSQAEYTSAIINFASIKQNQNIPQMEIGKSYNFINLSSKKDILAAITNNNILGTNIQNQPSSDISQNIIGSAITVFFPKIDMDSTIDVQPRIRGLGKPGSSLLITVNSTPQTGKVIVGPDGTWSFRPEKKLSPGIHYLTVQGYDNLGKLITVTRKFVVLKSGEAVLGESTPSASLTPTSPPPSTTSTPSPTITLPTLTPVPLSPTTYNPSPTTVAIPPKSGNTSATILLLGGGISLMLLGAKLFLPL